MTMSPGDLVRLFSYGTLQQPGVQRATFGRLLNRRPDALQGFALRPLPINDPHVVAVSGAAVHTIAHVTANASDVVSGVVFEVTQAELLACDAYEVSATRVEILLVSGQTAFAYVSRDG